MVSEISRILSFDTSVNLWYSSKVKYNRDKVAYNLIIVFVKGLQHFHQSYDYDVLIGAMGIQQLEVLWTLRVFKRSLTPLYELFRNLTGTLY